MQTNKLLSRFITTGTRLAILASMLMAAFTSNVTPALAAPRVGSVTVGAQTGTLTTGTGGQVTYLVTVAKGDTFSLTANLSVTGLPVDASYSFVPASLVWGSFLPAGTTRTSTLTIITTNTTPTGATPFTVTAVRDTNPADLASGAGTLTVLAASGNAQTITFAPLVDKTFGDPPFNLTATASSGLPVSFTASGNCTVDGSGLVTLIAAGSCTITAHQAGNASFDPAPDVEQTFTILVGGSGFDLYAVTGSTTLASQSVNVWGYNSTGVAANQPGGPTLTVNEGDVVTIRLHNQLGENTALLFQGQNVIPDRTGVANGGTKMYTFTASRPGTYLYEAGLLPNAQHQVAMGLYGALVVRPATAGQAYNDASTAFEDEAVLVLSEIDPALNNRIGGPAGFDMRKYAPLYFLINGKTYPNTDPIPTTGGNRVLLRYVNAGIQYHSMAVLGTHQTMIALDGSMLNFSRRYVAETIGPGQTADAIVTTPAATTATNRLTIYDGSLQLHNSNTAGFGGMLTFLTVTGNSGGIDTTTGPLTSNVVYAPGTLSATVSDFTTGNQNVTATEYYLDSTSGTGTAMVATDGTFDSSSEGVTLAVTVPAGSHTLYVRGQDSLGNWGAFSSVLANGGDLTGPTTSALSLSPGITNGAVNVALTATGNDTATGNSNVTAAEYFIDPVGTPANGSGTAMSVNIAAPIASLSASIPAAIVNGLTEGTHTVSVHSRDASGNWGALANITLTVDKTGPTTSGVSALPSPNNGTIPFNVSTPAVRVSANFLATLTNISAAEGFIDTVGANGTGFVFAANDGVFNSLGESGYGDIPLATIAQLTNGNHTIYVHGKDAAGNWGATATAVIIIDKIPPTVVSITRVDPDPTSAATVSFLITFSESVNGVTSANFTLVAPNITGAAITSVTGSGATRTVTVTTGSGGGGTLGLNLTSATGISDITSNALPTTGLPYVGPIYTQPTPSLYFSTFGNTNPAGVAGTADDADIYFWNGSAFSRSIDVTTITNPLPTGANVDGFDRVSATQFYMSFNGNVTVPGIVGTVADEDVVFYNAGTWSLFFDGSVNGVGGTDLDAISIVSGQLYFSTDNTTVPSGAGGTGDDADIYRWNGGSSYTRMVDASAVGWSTANVDGLVWVDATHVYLSYSADTTAPVIGAVEDEDVVRNNGGIWSVYFNGTARSLTSGNLDLDAFDLP